MNRKNGKLLLPYGCLLYFFLVQAAVVLRLILELLVLVPGAVWGLSGALIVFSGTVCLIVKILLRISWLIDDTAEVRVLKYRMAAECVVCFGLLYPAAMGFRDGMTALCYYKAMNLQILFPWGIFGAAAIVQDRLK